ncbi:Long-chain-alcohol dehydrogenase 1 [subsurface metagenome]
MSIMRPVNLYYPRKISFGAGCIKELSKDVVVQGISRIFLLTIPEILPVLERFLADLRRMNLGLKVDKSITREPILEDLDRVLAGVADFGPDLVLGIGGGSVMDMAKLVAAQLDNPQTLEEITGINKLAGRGTKLVCVPTTSGTGSEVSPNAILLDEREQLKKGVISPHLIPDMCYIDPELTLTVPRGVTAATGIDAFTHCLEAYVNKNSHPLVDSYALEGMRLIEKSLLAAVMDGTNLQARSDLSLGSLYGGMCLGPVNTTAIHALSYPLGSEFHIPHGLSNTILLPYVMEFNLPAAKERYADVANIFGIEHGNNAEQVAKSGIQAIRDLIRKCGLPSSLSEIKIPGDAIPEMAVSAMKVQRLLVNNPREVNLEDVIEIYKSAYKK